MYSTDETRGDPHFEVKGPGKVNYLRKKIIRLGKNSEKTEVSGAKT